MQLNNDILFAAINRAFPDAILHREEQYGQLILEVKRENIRDILAFCKENPEMQLNFLTTLNAMHFPDQPGRELAVYYHLQNFFQRIRLRLKVFMPITDPHIPTATTLWPTANWMERQEYDFFGIIFDGHPDLRRILNLDSMDVFPLRKEFRLEDGTRTDKDDRFFGRDGHVGRSFD